MTNNTQPEALIHAAWLEKSLTIGAKEAAAELRRLHDENAQLREQNNHLDAVCAKLEAEQGVQALSAAPAVFVPVSAFDRLHAHAESLAARLLAAEQATPKAAPVSSDTLYLLRRLLSNQHTLTGPEFRAELEKIVGEAYQQEAQEPSHRETVDVVGVRSNGEHVNLEKIAMPPRMKAREIAIEQFGRFKDDDGSDAEMCFGALEYFLEWLIQQGWSKAPQPAPAPLSESEYKRGYRDGYERRDAEVRGALV